MVKKVIFFLLIFNVVFLADDQHTREITINIISSSYYDVSITVENVGTVWDINNNISTSFPGGSIMIEFPQSVTGFDYFDGNSNTIVLGKGLYKISAALSTGTIYFYLDSRTSVWPFSPDTYFDLHIGRVSKFTIANNSSNINFTTQSLWDLAVGWNGIFSTAELEPFAPENLVFSLNGGNPIYPHRLDWNIHQPLDYFITGFNIYRRFYYQGDPPPGFSLMAQFTGSSQTSLVFFEPESIVIPGKTPVVEYIIRTLNGNRESINSNSAYMINHLPGATSPLSSDLLKLDEDIKIPKNSLLQNYPNPFNPSTQIRYDIAVAGFVSLKVYNSLGEEVATLVNENKNSGSYTINFNATGLASGIYFYKLLGNNYQKIAKMILLK